MLKLATLWQVKTSTHDFQGHLIHLITNQRRWPAIDISIYLPNKFFHGSFSQIVLCHKLPVHSLAHWVILPKNRTTDTIFYDICFCYTDLFLHIYSLRYLIWPITSYILSPRYPVVLNCFNLNPGTGGRGQFYGGDGVIRELLFRRSQVLSVLTERRVFQPYGLNGGCIRIREHHRS